MEKVTIKAYASKHKLSIFNVVKMTRSGEVPTETVTENGKEVTYILIDDKVENKVKNRIVKKSDSEPYSLKEENEKLKQEIQKLKEEITLLKNRVQ